MRGGRVATEVVWQRGVHLAGETRAHGSRGSPTPFVAIVISPSRHTQGLPAEIRDAAAATLAAEVADDDADAFEANHQ